MVSELRFLIGPVCLPQMINMMLYRAKQRGFLELDLLMVRVPSACRLLQCLPAFYI